MKEYFGVLLASLSSRHGVGIIRMEGEKLGGEYRTTQAYRSSELHISRHVTSSKHNGLASTIPGDKYLSSSRSRYLTRITSNQASQPFNLHLISSQISTPTRQRQTARPPFPSHRQQRLSFAKSRAPNHRTKPSLPFRWRTKTTRITMVKSAVQHCPCIVISSLFQEEFQSRKFEKARITLALFLRDIQLASHPRAAPGSQERETGALFLVSAGFALLGNLISVLLRFLSDFLVLESRRELCELQI